MTTATATHTEVNQLLDRLTEFWETVPEVAATFEQRSAYEQSDFVEEWPLEAMRLARLEQVAARGPLTPAQAARYGALRELVERHRPLLEQVLAR
jgi:hypothetical protein